MSRLARRDFLKFSSIGALAAAGFGASGCATESRRTVGGRPVLQVWAWDRNSRGQWHQNAWRRYRQQNNPDFELEFVYLPFEQLHDKILVAAMAGSGGPDICDIEISRFGNYVRGEPMFVDMGPELHRRNLVDQFYVPSALDPWSYRRGIYGIGSEQNTCLMCYRADLYEDAGVTTPIGSWDQLAEEARRYRRDTGRYLVDVEYLDWGEWWMFTLQQGGGFFDEAGMPRVADEYGIRTVEFRRKAVEDGWAMLSSNLESDSPQHFAALGNGTVATVFGPPWLFSGNTQSYLPETAGKWRLQPFPRWDGGGASPSRAATWGGTGVCVTRSCPLPDEAVDFVIFMHTDIESVRFDFDQRQNFPTYRPAYAEPWLNEPAEFFRDQPVGALIGDYASEINNWYNSPFWPQVTQATLRAGITPGMRGDLEPAVAMQNAQEEALKVIDLATP
ncbi:ABC transporter substrate-binding protein [Pseudonocardia kunmingensis]|uniref:L-arabinose-binding protein n=1 Tax=Pseudonocardia kunmingensis TaxID=630975 RepID=A0A543DQR6_9PSEU|nr:extracellular solute-binding protein [Pseudonocardia kunmingensis]TQM11666.1 L-arabinose-binding protein [Pseudonocardia kunmingensis]